MHHATWRLIDANTNRATEGLRLLEDAARLLLASPALAADLKSVRHDVAATINALDPRSTQRLAHRDTASDVGTSITTPSESTRPDWPAVALAAGTRTTEALRALEEAAKLISPTDPAHAGSLERCRYRVYDLHRDVVLALTDDRAHQPSRFWAAPSPRVCVLITESLCEHHAWDRVAELAIQGGATCLQLREKLLHDRQLLARAKRLVAIAAAADHPVEVVINDRPDIALLSGAHTVHLGQTDLDAIDARRLLGTRLSVGVSCSTLEHAVAAIASGADHVGLGPMFHTTTKHKDTLATPSLVENFITANWSNNQPPASRAPSRLPFWAIGGITPDNAHQIAEAVRSATVDNTFQGVGLAVSSCVCTAQDPAETCRALKAAFAPTHEGRRRQNTSI